MRGRGKKIGTAAALVLAAAAAGWFLVRSAPLGTLVPVLRGAGKGYLALGLGLMLAFVACEAAASRCILRALGERPRYVRCLHYSFMGFCCASLTPSSSGGQPAQIVGMCRDGIRAAHASLTMLLLAVCYQSALLALGGAAWLFSAQKGGMGWLLAAGAAVNLLLTLVMLGALFCPGLVRAAGRWGIRLGARLRLIRRPAAAREKLERGLSAYAAGAKCIRTRPGLIARVLLCTAGQVLCLAAVPWAVALALGTPAPAVKIMATQVVLTLSVAAFPMPGGSGAAEGGFLAVFAGIFPAGLLGSAMALCRGISCYLFLPICALLALATRGRKSTRERAAAPEGKRPAPLAQHRRTRRGWTIAARRSGLSADAAAGWSRTVPPYRMARRRYAVGNAAEPV